jgi:hypothetical protein
VIKVELSQGACQERVFGEIGEGREVPGRCEVGLGPLPQVDSPCHARESLEDWEL